jgi:cytochrome c-type biogenesis protein CcmH
MTASTEVRAAPAASEPSRRGRGPIMALVVAVAVAMAALVVVAARGSAGPPTLQERVHDIAEGLRCPVCQNLSVADSPSGIAQQMRDDIALRLHQGQTERQIDAFFTAKYGRWILLSPEAGGIGLFAWFAPVLAVAAGAGLAWTIVRRKRRLAVAGIDGVDELDEGSAEDADVDEPKLTEAERRVIQREIDHLDTEE